MKLKHILLAAVAATFSATAFASSEMDRKIEEAAEASYNYRTVLDGHVKVKAKDGVVTLTGKVDDKADKALAEDTVENLPGVEKVKNEIVVASDNKEHSDGWIAMKIRGKLLTRANVSAKDTKVAVKDGVVTLTGKVANAAQKDLTEAYAKDIDHVKSVKNDLVIVEPADKKPTVGESIDDASITTQVKYALLSHRSTSALKTKITTKLGVVAITGEAANDAEKSLVTKLAESVRGVKSVNNDMSVKS
jgi:hyperosmotically inducible protein